MALLNSFLQGKQKKEENKHFTQEMLMTVWLYTWASPQQGSKTNGAERKKEKPEKGKRKK